MSTAQRLAAGGMALAGFIPVVGWAGRAVKGGKGIYSAAKGISAAENAMSTYKNVKAFSTLEKTEMGIYGLLSANGLSEYVTGKDMFGNELTDQQRQASLTQSIFAGLPFVPGMAKEANRLGQQALNSTVQIGKQGADVSRAFMDDLGRSLNTSPNAAFAGGVGNMSSYLKAESRADVGRVSGDKEEYLSMLSGRGAVKETGQSTQEEVKKKMLPSEGDIGTYKDLNDAGQVGDDIPPHHMPSKEYLVKKLGWDRKEAKNDGMSINVEQPKTGGRHRKTKTYGRNMSNDAKEFYYSLEPRSAIAFDINDLRNIYMNDGLYKEMLPNLRRYVQEAKEDYYKNYLIKKK